MNKTIKKVFMVIALLVLIFLAWQLFFNDGGILQTGYNAVAGGINNQYAKVAGNGSTLIPQWGEINNSSTNGEGFNIDSTR